jgi:hypothetical protein
MHSLIYGEVEMRSSKIVITSGIMFVLAMAVAARADKVTAGYDHAVDFSKYKTFMWIQKPACKDPFIQERIVTAVNVQLVRKGLIQVGDGADLAVGANLGTQQNDTRETYYDGSGSGWSGWLPTEVRKYEAGKLTVDLFDGHTKTLVWQGVALDDVYGDPEKRTKDTFREIEKMFKEFPLEIHD